jgi:hypothetical protein
VGTCWTPCRQKKGNCRQICVAFWCLRGYVLHNIQSVDGSARKVIASSANDHLLCLGHSRPDASSAVLRRQSCVG